jgi:hypothetical protein
MLPSDGFVIGFFLQQQRTDAINCPSSSSSAVPLHSGCGGVVNSASSSKILPEPGEFPLREYFRLQCVRASAVPDDDHVVVLLHHICRASLDDGPVGTAERLNEPNPVAKSYASGKPWTTFPSLPVSHTDAASVMR